MNKNSVIAISAIVLLAGGTAGYMYWQSYQTLPEVAQVEEPATLAEDNTPEFPLKIDASPNRPPLPQLIESDSFVADAINTLLANESLMQIFINEKLIQNIVISIDNLPSNSLPINVMPIQTAAGSFITSGTGNNLVISPDNAERYTPYINVVDAMDTKKLVQLYIRLYPLFQQSYEELGYPDKYFNDRLMYVINDLLAAPDIEEPVKLVQPLVVYIFADPDLEAKNIGQRIMMRIGSKNEAKLKAKLNEIKQELLNHVSDMKPQV